MPYSVDRRGPLENGRPAQSRVADAHAPHHAKHGPSGAQEPRLEAEEEVGSDGRHCRDSVPN